MAEIRVEQKPKRSLAWLWLLIALVVIAGAIWYLNNDGVDTVRTTGEAALARPAVVATVVAPVAWLAA
jgi:hypothetical protein